MIKNLGYKILSISSLLIILTLGIVAFSTRSYVPIITNTATLDFANTLATTSSDLTITVNGAIEGDVVLIGIPNGSINGNCQFFGWVSSSNVVTIRFSNFSALAINPASGVFRATVIKQ